jgi:hypothetical protein
MKAASTMLVNRSAPLRCLARVAVDNWSSTTQSRQRSILEHRQKQRGPPHETRAARHKLQSQPHATPSADQRSCANQDIEAKEVDDTDAMRCISAKGQKNS